MCGEWAHRSTSLAPPPTPHQLYLYNYFFSSNETILFHLMTYILELSYLVPCPSSIIFPSHTCNCTSLTKSTIDIQIMLCAIANSNIVIPSIYGCLVMMHINLGGVGTASRDVGSLGEGGCDGDYVDLDLQSLRSIYWFLFD